VPAAPTLDGRALLGLVHLRLTGMPPVAPVNAVRVWADDVVATREQLALFTQKPRRDLRAADEAVARLRAELGDDAVVRPALRDGHLPEASFAWERLDRVVAARPAPRSADDPTGDRRVVRPLIRRMFTRPQPLVGVAALGLPASARLERDDGWLRASLEHGAVIRARGPYVISGGWWAHEVCREYHFAELRRGDLLWTFYDRNRRRWFWHGAVQ
jgi:protein ImuB